MWDFDNSIISIFISIFKPLLTFNGDTFTSIEKLKGVFHREKNHHVTKNKDGQRRIRINIFGVFPKGAGHTKQVRIERNDGQSV